ncbi:DUF927 domain-containing protein [Kushneria phosphatilytica]|uniref:DUF927 domain-containing protein n=1 Tax=Kushneria phosphatilytica TaxID=657387 RepID=A0A1S1NUZ3_9GAMM|nr:DUF927 domain-containing protein [Kushneria phosphatilytica]OHV10005.1 RNA helicase [Kushneria phosphatilytica]QEL11687.1 DUF927 domain-containing protein [Kushneria phosphatilytica]
MSEPRLSLVGEPAAPQQAAALARPGYAVYAGPTTVEGRVFDGGVWYHGLKQTGPDEPGLPFDLWICSPLYVDAETVDSEDGSIGRLVRFAHRGRERECVIPMEALAGKGEDVLRQLMRQGLTVAYNQRKHVPAYIASHHAPATVLATTTRTGWHAATGSFVLPHRVIGSDEVRYQSSGLEARIFDSRGTLAEWQQEVATPCLGNPVLILSLCCALSGPLLRRVGVHGGGIHLIGDSSSGKSLCQDAGASVWGAPDRFKLSWDMSGGGVEIEATTRNDTALIADEISRANPKRLQEHIYALANGAGKGTMTRDREGRPKNHWCVPILSSGERSAADHAGLSGQTAHAGAELRLVDINAGTRPYRAFDDVHGTTGEAFHRALTGAVNRHYGHAGPALIEQLLEREVMDGLPWRFGELRRSFDVASAQAGRVADRFAVMALAGELASEWSILPWPEGTALAACRMLFHEWLATIGDGNAEDRQILAALADFIARHGDSRFSDVNAQLAAHVINRAGFYEIDNGRRLFLFNRAALIEAAEGYSRDRILRTLGTHDVIPKTDPGRLQKKYRLPGGGSARFFVIDPERLDPERPA